jgi:GH24 family phage-related lysozyme (muramidase)
MSDNLLAPRRRAAPRRVRRVSARGLKFIAGFEGLRLEAYKAHPSEVHWTIGYGHYGPDVRPGMRITKEDALELLREDVRRFERAVKEHVPPRWREQRQHVDALCSVAYNLGEGVLTPEPPLTSLGEALRGRGAQRIGDAILLYDKAGGQTLPGLTRRRKAERRLFLTGSYSTQ